jgi:hypothetical protein
MIEKDTFKKAIYVVNALAFGDSSRASCIVYRPGMENVFKINLLGGEQRKKEFPINFYREGSLLSARPGHVQDHMYSMMVLRCKVADLISRGYSSVIIHSLAHLLSARSHFFWACLSVCLLVCRLHESELGKAKSYRAVSLNVSLRVSRDAFAELVSFVGRGQAGLSKGTHTDRPLLVRKVSPFGTDTIRMNFSISDELVVAANYISFTPMLGRFFNTYPFSRLEHGDRLKQSIEDIAILYFFEFRYNLNSEVMIKVYTHTLFS